MKGRYLYLEKFMSEVYLALSYILVSTYYFTKRTMQNGFYNIFRVISYSLPPPHNPDVHCSGYDQLRCPDSQGYGLSLRTGLRTSGSGGQELHVCEDTRVMQLIV